MRIGFILLEDHGHAGIFVCHALFADIIFRFFILHRKINLFLNNFDQNSSTDQQIEAGWPFGLRIWGAWSDFRYFRPCYIASSPLRYFNNGFPPTSNYHLQFLEFFAYNYNSLRYVANNLSNWYRILSCWLFPPHFYLFCPLTSYSHIPLT